MPILEQLAANISTGARLLEVGSGSGQHAIFFASELDNVTWQPTDQGEYFPGLEHNIQHHAPSNILPPLYLDLTEPDWQRFAHCSALYSANVIHIMPEALLPQMFTSPCNLLMFYGPYKYGGDFTSESNANFDLWLKERNPLSGIRDIETLLGFAKQKRYELQSDKPMPANNQFLVFSRT